MEGLQRTKNVVCFLVCFFILCYFSVCGIFWCGYCCVLLLLLFLKNYTDIFIIYTINFPFICNAEILFGGSLMD